LQTVSRRDTEAWERRVLAELPQGPTARTRKQGEKFRRFNTFAPEFLNTYAATNNKPSEVESKEQIIRLHLMP